jgi:hypothetical protein
MPVIGVVLFSMTEDQALVAGDQWLLHRRLLWLAIGLVIAYWLERDTRRTRLMRVYERGLFFFVGWPIVLPYYLIRTRGPRKGLAIMLKWMGAYIAIVVIASLFGHVWTR